MDIIASFFRLFPTGRLKFYEFRYIARLSVGHNCRRRGGTGHDKVSDGMTERIRNTQDGYQPYNKINI